MDLDADDLVLLFDRIGIVAFALSGVEVGVRRRLDIFGLLVMGVVTATGGGLMRDVVLTRLPFVIDHEDYLLWAGGSSVAAIALFWANRRVPPVLLAVADAAGLGAFAVAGSLAGIEAGLGLPAIVLLAIVTGTGGGVIRDLMADRVPLVLRSEVNATAAAVGAVVVWGVEDYSTGLAALAGVAVTAMVRVGGLAFGLNLPRPGGAAGGRQGRLVEAGRPRLPAGCAQVRTGFDRCLWNPPACKRMSPQIRLPPHGWRVAQGGPMQLQFGEKEEQLRKEVRSFLLDQLSVRDERGGGQLGSRTDEDFEFALKFNQELGRRGWIAPAWPKEYGGLGASIYEQMVFNEEFGYYGAPDTGTRGFGVGMIGPTLIIHGSEEQKKRYLPRITSGEDIWCQGYSEPGAGSDLASLQTRAVRDGDEYVINGQKIWTSGGHRANQMFCLVRTDPEAPKHRGITFLLIDDIKNTPGLTIRPLINMANRHHFNEVFFEDVRVPVENRVGEENRGWYVGMTLLDFERSGIGTTASQKHTLEKLTQRLKDSPAVIRERNRHKLAEHVIENNVARFLGYRIGYIQAKGQVPNYEASVVKIFQSELGQRIYNFGVNMLGMSGQFMPEEPTAPLGGDLPESYIQAVPSSIYSGSNEIQRNIIATRGLGLPRA